MKGLKKAVDKMLAKLSLGPELVKFLSIQNDFGAMLQLYQPGGGGAQQGCYIGQMELDDPLGTFRNKKKYKKLTKSGQAWSNFSFYNKQIKLLIKGSFTHAMWIQ